MRKEREFPKPLSGISPAQKNEDFLYDRSVRAYRYLPKEQTRHSELRPGVVIRDALGRKIQREDELLLLNEPGWKRLSTSQTVAVGAGVGVAMAVAVAEVIVLFPCVVVFSVVGLVLGIPSLPLSTHLEATYVTEAQQSYMQGRTEFLAGSYQRALDRWDHGEELMPSLRAYSDVNYWRGQTFDALHQPRSAAIAYGDFLAYSESAVPSYFRLQIPEGLTWPEMADRAEARLSDITGGAKRTVKAVALGPGGMPDE